MIRCKECGKLSKRGTPTFLHNVQTRKVEYPNGGKGWEIVKEVRVCSPCHEKWGTK